MKRKLPLLILLLLLIRQCFIFQVDAGNIFVSSVNGDVYHVSSCRYVRQIKEYNIIYFNSPEEAEASGRRGCSRCHPEKRKTQEAIAATQPEETTALPKTTHPEVTLPTTIEEIQKTKDYAKSVRITEQANSRTNLDPYERPTVPDYTEEPTPTEGKMDAIEENTEQKNESKNTSRLPLILFAAVSVVLLGYTVFLSVRVVKLKKRQVQNTGGNKHENVY